MAPCYKNINCLLILIFVAAITYCLILFYDECETNNITQVTSRSEHLQSYKGHILGTESNDWDFIHGHLVPGFIVAKYSELSLEHCNLSSSTAVQICLQKLQQKTLELHATSFSSHGHIKIQLKPSIYWVKKWDLSKNTKYFGTYYLRNTLGPWCYLNDTKCTSIISLNNSYKNSINLQYVFQSNCTKYNSKICIPSELIPNKSYQQTVLERIISGAKYVQNNLKLIIGILVKNYNEQRLNHIFKLLDSLGILFIDYRVIIIENDSADSFGTVQVLRDKCEHNDKYICINSIFHLHKNLKNYGAFSDTRIKSMTFLRNLVVEYTKMYYDDWDYLMMADGDEIVTFNDKNLGSKHTSWPWSVMTSFYGESNVFDYNHLNDINNGWSIMCSNGMIADKAMWDTFPFISKYVDELFLEIDWDLHPGGSKRPKWWQIANKYNIELIPVNSCFAPFTIYKIQALVTTNCGYYFLSTRISEHVTLHNCLARHNKTAYVNPYMFGYALRESEVIDNNICVCVDI